MRWRALVVVAGWLAAAGVGRAAAAPQGDLAAREAQLAQRAVPALHALADGYAKQKQHRRALGLRRSIWLDYAPDDAAARGKCGFVRVGEQWRFDAGAVVLDQDLRGDKAALRKLDTEWTALQKELAREHRALATAHQQAGANEAAARHFRLVLQYAPGDAAAAAALVLDEFEGFRGSPDELALLRRARAIRGAVDWLRRTPVPVARIEAPEPLLQRAGLAHTGVATEHFRVFGTLPPALLEQAAQYCERALWLGATLLPTQDGAPLRAELCRDYVFVAGDAEYGKVLDLCHEQFAPERLQFLKTQVDLAYLRSGDRDVRFVKQKHGEPEVFDQAVRGVVQDALGIRTDGLWEGIGHAACGLLFGRTLTFLLEQQRERTAASFTQTPLLPDMATWMRIAEQSAWAKSDTRTSELVLVSGARFTNEQRVKAWAICDYLVHWRPEWLPQLDRCRGEAVRTPPDVEAEFLRRTGGDLAALDRDWREHWAKGQALRAAMAQGPLDDPKHQAHAARLEGRAVVDAIDAARVAAGRGPGGYSVAAADAAAVLDYFARLAKAEAEQRRKPKDVVPLPAPPAGLGSWLLGARQPAAAAVAGWLRAPVARDALLHPGRLLFGAAASQAGAVVDLRQPVLPVTAGLPSPWPRHGQVVPAGGGPPAELGPRAAAALAAAGRAATDPVGTPLTLHWHRAVPAPDLAAVRAEVTVGGVRVAGSLVVYQAEEAAADAAAGLVAFVPHGPWPAGELEVVWTLPAGLRVADAEVPPLRARLQ